MSGHTGLNRHRADLRNTANYLAITQDNLIDSEMTKTTRRTEIPIEGQDVKAIHIRGGRSALCTRCQAQTISYTPEEIAVFLQISVTEVCRRVESAQIHLTQNGRGAAKICGHSLEKL